MTSILELAPRKIRERQMRIAHLGRNKEFWSSPFISQVYQISAAVKG